MSLRTLVTNALEAVDRQDPTPLVSIFAKDAVAEFIMIPSGPPLRFEGKAAIAEVMEGVRRVHRLVGESCSLYVDEESAVVTAETSTIIQETNDSPPMRTVQAVIIHFTDDLITLWRAYRSAVPVSSLDESRS